MDFEVGQGDTVPTITDVLPADLRGTTVVLRLRPADFKSGAVDLPATFGEAQYGQVKHAWLASETARAGLFLGQWVVTTPGVDDAPSSVQTFPAGDYVRILIKARL